MRIRPLLLVTAVAALALPAPAQQVPQLQPQQAPQQPAGNTVAPAPAPAPRPRPRTTIPLGQDESAIELLGEFGIAPPPKPVEYPGWARRDPWLVGRLDPVAQGLGANPWGGASGAFLSTLMRRMNTPIASRWSHIALRRALLGRIRAPAQVNPVDWVAERAWLLLRMGEADAARMLVAGVDTDRFTPKMAQVAVQAALASADPSALCPIEDQIRKHDPAIRQLVQAMCSALAGEPESAAAQVDQARRFGRIGGIDLALAQKVVGAAGSSTNATIEWQPVESLTAWRFGLATATGMELPGRLLSDSPPRLRAFQARAPLLSAEQRLDSAFIAAGLGVFSSQTMVDLYSTIYDSTDAADLADSDAWQLRQAFVGQDRQARIAAIRRLLALGRDALSREGARAAVARAASLIEPDSDLGSDAPELISAMLAAGYDQAAARWIPAIDGMEDQEADRCWAMLALAAPNIAEVGNSRLASFIRRDQSPAKVRSALLVAGLAGLGRISSETANSLNRRHGLGLGRTNSWTRMIDSAAARGQAGTVLVLVGTGFQTSDFAEVPPAHLFHAVMALGRTGQAFIARMVAAEALSRT